MRLHDELKPPITTTLKVPASVRALDAPNDKVPVEGSVISLTLPPSEVVTVNVNKGVPHVPPELSIAVKTEVEVLPVLMFFVVLLMTLRSRRIAQVIEQLQRTVTVKAFVV